MTRVATDQFSRKRSDLILQIRWLLNEMGAATNYIESGDIDEALKILRKETEDNYWMKTVSK